MNCEFCYAVRKSDLSFGCYCVSSSSYYSQLELPASDSPVETTSYRDIGYPVSYVDETASSYDPDSLDLDTYVEGGISMVSSFKVVSMFDYGAKADGSADDSEAFGKAWMAACSSSGSVRLMIHEKRTYLLHPVTFSGSCNSSITVMPGGHGWQV